MTYKPKKWRKSKNNAPIAKPAQDKNVLMLYITLAIVHSVHASLSQ